MKEKYTLLHFTTKSKEKHQNKYIYPNQDWPGVRNKVLIICPTHGEFYQVAHTHLKGSGCPACAKIGVARKSFDELVNQFRLVHGDKYIYPEQEYKGSTSKVNIICKDHGLFSQTSSGHAMGSGCFECAKISIRAKNTNTLEQFVSRANKIHCGKYEYPEQPYTGDDGVISIKCKTHGLFNLLSRDHTGNKKGCEKCSNDKKFLPLLEKAKIVHKNKYDYPKQDYSGSLVNKILIICPVHGEFKQSLKSHIKGNGCRHCGKELASSKTKFSFEKAVSHLKLVHGDTYEYPMQEYVSAASKLKIVCKEHGEFYQAFYCHKEGQGCPKCGVASRQLIRRPSFNEVLDKCRAIHGDTYQYPEQECVNGKTMLKIICKKHGEFSQLVESHVAGSGCRQCTSSSSKGELELASSFSEFSPLLNHRFSIKEFNNISVIKNSKQINIMELDVFFKELNVAVEFNGLYWHSEALTGKHFHKGKTEACKELGIDLIQVFEDEWTFKKDIVKSIISTRLGVYENRYYARKTTLVEVDSATAGVFYDANHIQGKVSCNKHYGLSFNGEIIAMASFGNRSHLFKNNNDIELIRFCTKLNTQVVGGLSKLLAAYKGVAIKTYCDIRLFNGEGYKAVGFKELHVSSPSYYYFKGNKRMSRFSFQKHKLEKVLDNFDSSLSEYENMKNNGYSRIFDCGSMVLIKE